MNSFLKGSLDGPNDSAIVDVVGVKGNSAESALIMAPRSGMYRVNCYIVNTATGAGDTFPNVVISSTDETGRVSGTISAPTDTKAGSIGNSTIPVRCLSGNSIAYTVVGGTYTNGLIFNLHFVIESI